MDGQRAAGAPTGGATGGAAVVPAALTALARGWGVHLLGPVAAHPDDDPRPVPGPDRTGGTDATPPVGTWAARDATGARLLLEVVPTGTAADDGGRDRALDAGQALVGLAHEHVARVHAVARLGPGRLALLVEHVPGHALPALAVLRPRLDAGEAAGVALPLALALAVLHDRGLTVGGLTGAGVVVRPDGVPVLADLRGCLERPGAGVGDRAADVRALVRTVLAYGPDGPGAPTPGDDALRAALRAVAEGGAPTTGAVAAACARAVTATPVRSPDAGRLVREALRGPGAVGAAPALPVRRRRRAVRPPLVGEPAVPVALPHRGPDVAGGTGPASGLPARPGRAPRRAADHRPGQGPEAGRRVRRRRTARRGRAGMAAGLTAVLAVVAGVVLASPGAGLPEVLAAVLPARTAPGTDVRPGAKDATASPVEAAVDLTRRRAAVLAGSAGRGSAAVPGLAEIEVEGGPAWSSDVALLATLDGVVLHGLDVTVLSAEPAVGDAPATTVGDGGEPLVVDASVLVRTRTDTYERVVGGVVEPVAALPATEVVLDLVQTDDGWRVWAVRAGVPA